ncbi:hypothetical protein AMELA_G00199150 [Ameiurus melas]|uniref:Uncharacterized protein n=1 Tax=Ameiurus melas TaxID=219545 RepID=A0A7J6A8V8_AMEME|nr:hypothetical protein AMELA_G00199150 [Ameiurus melas]
MNECTERINEVFKHRFLFKKGRRPKETLKKTCSRPGVKEEEIERSSRAVMTGDRSRAGERVQGRSYKDAAVTNLPADFNKTPPPNPRLQTLNKSLRELFAAAPDGVSLTRSSPGLSSSL